MEVDCNLEKLGQLFQVVLFCFRNLDQEMLVMDWFTLLSRIHLIYSPLGVVGAFCAKGKRVISCNFITVKS